MGEAGCGKSEIAVNFALSLTGRGKEIHFFDLDMTKPLFRSRDLEEMLAENGVVLHYEKQFMDTPTEAGGIGFHLKSKDEFTVLDIGGDYVGARSVGKFAMFLNSEDTVIYYVINPFRPWSDSLEHIDMVLCDILGVSHVAFDRLHYIVNPNLGPSTAAVDFLEGVKQLYSVLPPEIKTDFYCARSDLCDELKDSFEGNLFPLRLFMGYPWEDPA